MKKLATSIFTLLTCLPLLIFSQNVRMVKDLNPGSPDGFPLNDAKTGLLANLDTVLIFVAAGKGNSTLICRSDGGPSINTIALLPPFTDSDKMESFAVADGLFWFLVNRDATADLYSTDGTLAGTKLRYQMPTAHFSKIRAFAGGVVFHEIIDSTDHFLTHFDPSKNAAARVSQFNSFAGILDLAVRDTTIFGIGCAEKSKPERYLFKSNGQIENLDTIVLLNSGTETNAGIFLTPVGDRLFFFFQKNGETKKLWVSDGSAAGTVGVKTMDTNVIPTLYSQGIVVDFNGKFVFRGKSSNSATGIELWKSDGTANGTDLIRDIVAGNGSSSPRNLTILDGKLFFTATNAAGNDRIWETNLTTAGTKMVLPDFTNAETHGAGLTIYQDSLAFGAFKDSLGSELMFCKGTDASLKIVSNESQPDDKDFAPSNLVAAGHLLFFVAGKAGFGRELWVYNSSFKPIIPTQNIENQPVLKISPNPGSSFFQIDLPSETTGFLRVFSADGRLFLEKETAGTTVLETENWPTGRYFLQFLNEKIVANGVWIKF